MDRFLEFAGNNTLLVFALVTSFFLVVFSELRRKAAGVSNIEPPDLVRLVNSDAIVVDVRSADAYARGHIVGSKNIPMDELEARVDSLQSGTQKPVIAVCQAGVSSNKAIDALRKGGFESVYGLKGGMAAWEQAGMPVVTGKKTKSKR